MKYKFRWLSLIVIIGIYLPSFLEPTYLKEGTNSNALYYNIFSPIFLIWLIWACWKIIIIIKGKIFPTAEKRSQVANFNEFNRNVYGDELTLGKILIRTLKFIWSTFKFILKIPVLLVVTTISLIFKIISSELTSETSSPQKSSSKNSTSVHKIVKIKLSWGSDLQKEWEYDGRILKPSWGSDPQKEWEYNGRILKPSWGNDLQKEWEYNGRILKPSWGSDYQKKWETDSSIPIPVLAKAAGII